MTELYQQLPHLNQSKAFVGAVGVVALQRESARRVVGHGARHCVRVVRFDVYAVAVFNTVKRQQPVNAKNAVAFLFHFVHKSDFASVYRHKVFGAARFRKQTVELIFFNPMHFKPKIGIGKIVAPLQTAVRFLREIVSCDKNFLRHFLPHDKLPVHIAEAHNLGNQPVHLFTLQHSVFSRQIDLFATAPAARKVRLYASSPSFS